MQSGGDEDEFPDDQLLLIKEWIELHQKNDEDENKDNIDQEKDNDDINLIDKDDNMEENTNEEEEDKDYDNINQIIGKNKNQKSKQNKMQKKINSLKQHPLDQFLHKQLLQLAKHNKIKISKLFPDSEVNDAFIAPKAIPYDFNIQQIIDIEKPFSNGEEDCKKIAQFASQMMGMNYRDIYSNVSALARQYNTDMNNNSSQIINSSLQKKMDKEWMDNSQQTLDLFLAPPMIMFINNEKEKDNNNSKGNEKQKENKQQEVINEDLNVQNSQTKENYNKRKSKEKKQIQKRIKKGRKRRRLLQDEDDEEEEEAQKIQYNDDEQEDEDEQKQNFDDINTDEQEMKKKKRKRSEIEQDEQNQNQMKDNEQKIKKNKQQSNHKILSLFNDLRECSFQNPLNLDIQDK